MKKIITFFGIIIVLCASMLGVTVIAIFHFYNQPLDPTATETTVFTIPKGQATITTGDRLYDAGLIKHPLLFRLAVKKEGVAGKIQAGSFELSPSMTVGEIALALTQGTQDIWITILEGWRMEQIAESLASQELPAFDPDMFISLVKTQNTEGKLFPETYLIPREYTAKQIHDLLISTFERKVVQDLAAELDASEHSLNTILTMASLIEREAREYEEMRGVSGVLWHRIDIGMPLQVDATMQYAKGYDSVTQNWWSPPRAADKAIDSPFNTYQVNGLPPSPIANPSLNAIKATLKPVATKNLFYIHDRSGTIHFAQTLDEHNANVNRYLR